MTETDSFDQDAVVELDHRGAFGEFGASDAGFIDRSFRERIVLVGVSLAPHDLERTDAHLDELERLVDTAGADVVARVIQRRDRPDPATYVGSGKAQEIRELAIAHDCDTVVFDDELTPAQQFKLERILGRTAIDRTAVILDIFAQNASSIEGKAQVELAQTQYRLPRLRGKGTALSQQAGGIGTRGPGETQLEVDRRRLVRRVHKLQADLQQISNHRSTQRKARSRSGTPQIAIVGYTNAGKSTLLNALTQAGVISEDRLFATLDATTRRLSLPGGMQVLVTDTVGFVRKLPHQLVQAFRSTLEVASDADLLIHVVDGSAPDPHEQIAAVREVLNEIGADQIDELVVINKCDIGEHSAALARQIPGSVLVSAAAGVGLEALLEQVSDRLLARDQVSLLRVPCARGDVLAALHRHGQVLEQTTSGESVELRVRLGHEATSRFAEFEMSQEPLPT